MKQRVLSPLSVFDEPQLRMLFAEFNVNEKHINSIYRHIIQNGVTSFDDIPQLPVRIIAPLKERFVFSTSRIAERMDASDNSTTKLLVELQDGQRVETVIMRYGEVELKSFPESEKVRRQKELNLTDRPFKSKKRATVCLSSQVGCAMGCTFCATGTMGLLSNLTTGEIVEQLVHANTVEKIRNVVFMGMGEPLDNYEAVLGAINAMIDTSRFSLSPTRITVSTVGVAPRILSLMRDVPQIGLALSLHAPSQALRQQIVPSSKAYSLEKILDATFAFIENQNKPNPNNPRHILVEYVLIENINSSTEVAHELGQLFAHRVDRKDVLVNVIPYNPTDVVEEYEKPTPETLKNFVAIVRSYGVHTLIRQELGQDIASACGQLVVKKKRDGCNGDALDLEDIGKTKSSVKAVGSPRVSRKAGTVTKKTGGNFRMRAGFLTYDFLRIGGTAFGMGLLGVFVVRTLLKK
ncbi:sorting nexin [Entophlyctis luteolus]|nr:sorting nexin [Entophlyctis luteolus]